MAHHVLRSQRSPPCHRGAWRRARLCLERLEDRTLLTGSHTLDTALPLPFDPTGQASAGGSLPSSDFFKVTLTETGRLTTQVHATGADTRLSLLGTDGGLLIQSDGQSATNPDDLIAQHLVPGTYFLEVQSLDSATGTYTLTSEFVAAVPPFAPLPVSGFPEQIAKADFNEDGITDLAVASAANNSFSLLLGLGDGTFQKPQEISVGSSGGGFSGIVAGDFNGDGHIDVALAKGTVNEVAVLLGRGDGAFQAPMWFAVGANPVAVVAADFNGDGGLDLAIQNAASRDISVLLGRGDGTFHDQVRYAGGGGVNPQGFPVDSVLVAGDFNQDGHIDLASTNYDTNDVSVLLGRRDGTFQDQVRFATGNGPFKIVTGDFNGDGRLDLAVLENTDVALLLGRGDGTFADPIPIGGWSQATNAECVAGDFNGDGRFDLAVIHGADGAVFLGRGDGTFAAPVPFHPGDSPNGIIAGDFNADGGLDLAIGSFYDFNVSILFGRGDGTFFDQGHVGAGAIPSWAAIGDFNGDGRPDLAVETFGFPGIQVFLGLGDGMFQQPIHVPVVASEANNQAIIAGDFNNDGILDLAVAGANNDVLVFLGRGDGTFQDEGLRFAVGAYPVLLLAGDCNGDGNLDLATANTLSQNISILLGRGDGTFQQPVLYPEAGITSLTVGDCNGDHILDLASVDQAYNQVTIRLGRGDGTFQAPYRLAAGSGPGDVVSGDFNGDGRLDIATFNYDTSDVSVLSGNGDGTFQDQLRSAVGSQPLTGSAQSLIVSDFNGDGRLDLAAVSAFANNVTVLLGRGDGTFQPPVHYSLGPLAYSPKVGDFNGDGRPDLVCNSLDTSSNLFLLFNRGDGTFRSTFNLEVGTTLTSSSLATGDLNLDGRLDVLTSRPNSGDVAVLLGRGDGTLRDPVPSPQGTTPVAVLTGDFNGDGRLDLASVNYDANDVTVSLGLGDGTYQAPLHFAVGIRPIAHVMGDFDRDGHLDLAVANAGSNGVSLLLGRGDGTFEDQVRLAVGALPDYLITGDFNGDGRLDLAVANYLSADIALLLGRGDGTFQPGVRLPVGPGPVSLAAGDFNRDGRLDLAVVLPTSNQVAILLQLPNGTFQHPVRFAAGTLPRALVAKDFNGDGLLDLAIANNNSNDVSVLLGRGDGTFQDQVRYPAGAYPFALAACDINGDGRLDLITADQLGTETTILLGLGDGTFVNPDTIANTIHATPLVADFNKDGAADVAVVNGAGEILLRLGRPNERGVFDAPVMVNPDPRFAARDLASVATPGGLVLAALDARSSSVSLYSVTANGKLTRTSGFKVPGTLAVRLVSGDLNGDGRDDLVVATAGSQEAFVYLQNTAGGFGPEPDYRVGVGVGPLDITLVDVNGDQRPDIVVTNHFSGDVSVLLNDPAAPFSSELRFRASTGLYFLDDPNGTPVVRSTEGTTGIIAGQFEANSQSELIVTNSAANSFSILRGTGSGGLFNAQRSQSVPTGLGPTQVVSGHFNNDPILDVAVLDEASADISIFRGDGQGGFTHQISVSAGNSPTGLTVADVNGDGKDDLLVGNTFGDVLTLLGKGDGTFQPYRRAAAGVALAVADLNGDGRVDFIVADKSLDRVTVQYAQPGQSFEQDRQNGLLAPAAVKVADLNGDGIPDLIVANGGANDVLVYPGLGNGQFGPGQAFATGTNPVGITVGDVNSDHIPDLVVANQGSNDLTVLLGNSHGANWTFQNGPRLQSGGLGPVSVAVSDLTGPKGTPDGLPDLLVSNSGSNTVSLLPGVGGGFFNDSNPLTRATGVAPGPVLPISLLGASNGVLVVNSGSNDLTLFTDFAHSSASETFASGGIRPVAAAAGDFNNDGRTDVLVANNGDGVISLLVGGEEGLTLARLFTRDDVRHPTDVEVGSDSSAFYVTQEGGESVARFGFTEETVAGFTLNFGIAVPFPGGLGFRTGEPGQRIADLAPLHESGLPTVAALATVASDSAAPTQEAAGVAEGALSGLGSAILFLVSGVPEAGARAGDSGGGGNEDVPPASDDPDSGARGPTVGDGGQAVDDIVIGLDEALQRHRTRTRERLFEVPPPAPAPGMEGALDKMFRSPQPDMAKDGESPECLDSALACPDSAERPVPISPSVNLSGLADPWMAEPANSPGTAARDQPAQAGASLPCLGPISLLTGATNEAGMGLLIGALFAGVGCQPVNRKRGKSRDRGNPGTVDDGDWLSKS